MAKNKTTITVGGKEYHILSDDPKEYVRRVGFYLDEKMRELNSEYVSLSTLMLTTLTALNITDEYLKAHDALEAVTKEVEQLREAVRDLQIQNEMQMGGADVRQLRETVRRLKAENDALRQHKDAKLTNLKHNANF